MKKQKNKKFPAIYQKGRAVSIDFHS